MNFYFFYLFALLLNYTYLQSKIIKFKFEKYPINVNSIYSIIQCSYFQRPEEEILALKDFLYRLLTDDFYFNLTLGTPPQIIPTIWNMHQYSFKFYEKSFNENKSSSFKNISTSFWYNFDESNYAILCEDKFNFIDDNNNSFYNNLVFLKFEQGGKNYSLVGLQLPDYIEDDLLTFPRALKQYNIINKYIFFIYYNKYQNNEDILNYNGDIYFGDYPHNIKEFSNEFNENDFYEIKASYRSRLVYWDILFDNIYFGKDNYDLKIEKKQAELLGNMRLSVGTEEYKDYISKNFFDKYINNSICEFNTLLNNTDYQYFVCQNNKELFDISKFPSLNFYLKEINFVFSLNYKDLFFIYNNKIYFGIIFDKFFRLKFNQRWKLGSAIFKKYLFTFNQDTKMIGFYKKVLRNNEEDEDYSINNPKKDEYQNENRNYISNKNKKYIKIIIIIFLVILIIILILIIRKYIKRNIKKVDSKKINFVKGNKAHDSKNKNIVHEYYELGNNLIE